MTQKIKPARDYFIDPILMEQLDKVKDRVLHKDHDWFCIIDGEEGSGKSVLAMQIMKYRDPDATLDNIVFTADNFKRIIKDPKTKKGSCIILDEAFSSANSRASLTEVNRSMIAVATEMRQKNLFIIFVLPTFFDLDRAFALWRAKVLIHVYFKKDFTRGQYVIFPKNIKKELYLTGKKKYSYAFPHSPYPPCRFPNRYVVDETEYRLKKAEAFKKRVISYRAQQWLKQRNAYLRYIKDKLSLSNTDLAKVPAIYGAEPLSERLMEHILNDNKEPAEESG